MNEAGYRETGASRRSPRLTSFFADLHIHIGRTESGLPVKISAARNLTFDQIVRESAQRKGLDMIGIIDAHSPPVQEEIATRLEAGVYREHPDGGLVYGETVVILGTEIEVKEPGFGTAHLLAYFPSLDAIRRFTHWLTKRMKNVQLSTQRLYAPVRDLQEKVTQLDGLMIPAHVFTPFKSVYGSASDRMRDWLDLDRIAAVELGLSADSSLADRLSELSALTFVTNSDAHSIPKIGREYNELCIAGPSFLELKWALLRQDGRRVVANYGLNPKLGKYYRTRCLSCEALLPPEETRRCLRCGSHKVVKGVSDRVEEIADQPSTPPAHRPPYVYQVPLEFIPKLGPKTLGKLLDRFGSEMRILHHADIEEIASIAGTSIAEHIRLAREQRLQFDEGGGGMYGKVKQIQNQPS
ncbi:endonuclease Q family protein [Polycladomyces subterraneus]|uniref:Endonuclease Q family protein n=1 Tax=Polycladomyces subterraneus TaxID=1016997 RepID=A0ABT8IPS7_9BACL|nr:endonuclease Q family protein [Polycladomyces subterraneus]MDN4594119.1 endonuclease Q family protein [Polycladomyces subterraneus]